MIKNILGFEKNANNIANALYYKTLGNPLFTVGTIEELYENKTLFFDVNIGEWKTKKDFKIWQYCYRIIIKIRTVFKSNY